MTVTVGEILDLGFTGSPWNHLQNAGVNDLSVLERPVAKPERAQDRRSRHQEEHPQYGNRSDEHSCPTVTDVTRHS
ncbi:hypothetical protein ABZV78_06565 [Micromonospora sp. NPDC004540]|uniref:hypothetical protein n=1 Tax=Micromonospora sp. NPDC004540 TaxID=3154457 RepID=UPI0033B38DD0